MSSKNVIVTAVLTSILTTIVTYFGLDIIRKRPWAKSNKVDVPLVLGLSQAQAESVLRQQGLKLSIMERRPDRAFPAGTICTQVPVRGDHVPRGSVVTAVLSTGIARVKVPAIVGKDIATATAALSKAGLKVGAVRRIHHPTMAKDLVVAVKPLPGATVDRGKAIDITVSEGLDTAEVPKLKGRYYSSAKKKIIEAGFVVGKVRWRDNDDYDDYQVLGQEPKAGTKAPKGSPIDITVNRGD
ncbi:MAG: PASTA domain-containing protein [Deltaproteobacteria bacterium]|nr:PASTA domain-containing protein [Deltaproteobacteria bacterium]